MKALLKRLKERRLVGLLSSLSCNGKHFLKARLMMERGPDTAEAKAIAVEYDRQKRHQRKS